MTKGDDAIMRKKNKAKRKKLNRKESSNVSARVAAIIAAKNRRKTGKRSKCQGMCFSLPTPEDPFNDRHGNKDFEIKETKKKPPQVDKKAFVKGKSSVVNKGTSVKNNVKVDTLEQMKEKNTNSMSEPKKSPTSIDNLGQRSAVDMGINEILQNAKSCATGHQGKLNDKLGCPSKFLILCLNAIENDLRQKAICEVEEELPLFANSWGVEFWKCFSSGEDFLDSSGSSSTAEQIAWIASTAADTIARKEKEGHSFTSPFLLFLVPSQEKAAKVRSLCKPLKVLGIHTVSVHSGAALDHQINGLKSCEPEFLISTPERLLELIYLKAIDISGISLLVVDGLESFQKGGYFSCVNSIRHNISGKPNTVVFNDSLDYASIKAVQNLLVEPINRFSRDDSVASQSACIIQSVNVCASEEEILMKAVMTLDAYLNHLVSQPRRVLCVVGKDRKSQKFVSTLKSKSYSISTSLTSIASEVNHSDKADNEASPVTIIDKAQIDDTAELEGYEVVIILDSRLPMEDYIEILTSMARHTVNGKLHSFLTKKDASNAAELVEILEQCGQEVPVALRDMCSTSPMLES